MEETRICQLCGWRKADHHHVKGKIYWRKDCSICSRLRRNKPTQVGLARVSPVHRPNFILPIGTNCEICGWFGYCHRHHKDGNHYNDDLTNIQMLCPNCHMEIHFGKPTPH